MYSFKILFDVVIITFDVVTNSTPPFKANPPTTPLVYRRIMDTYTCCVRVMTFAKRFDIQLNEIFHAG